MAYPGELIALMGASGAGKTTLLNVLTFRNSDKVEVSGVRALNGVPVTSNQLTSISAYVQQDDLFIGTLTVREHLIFQALVRMDRHISYSQRMIRVEQVISEVRIFFKQLQINFFPQIACINQVSKHGNWNPWEDKGHFWWGNEAAVFRFRGKIFKYFGIAVNVFLGSYRSAVNVLR